MKISVFKLAGRSIRSFWGRYLALLLIVTLSVGFFSGLKITKDAMANTCGDYLSEQNFYDFRLISTSGMTESDVTAFSELSGVKFVEGSYSTDALTTFNDRGAPFKLISMPERINLPSLTAGRMPETNRECLGDAAYFSDSEIGSVIQIETEDAPISQMDFTVVGLADSPLYLGDDRGTTSIGNGTLAGFLYLPQAVFMGEAYTEAYLMLYESAAAYSEEYDKLIENKKPAMSGLLEQRIQERYEDLLDSNHLTQEKAEAVGISEPKTYLLTRNENTGYMSFENDTSIVSGIANIFPFFFILIAMLVCITTMTRMVDEERSQIGVLKAMGYSNAVIIAKYLLYAGSATVIGWIAGFFLGTWGLPKVFWLAYNSLYNFAPIKYLFSPWLAVATLAVALMGILGSTWSSCRKELYSDPADLLRPHAPKAGKRIWLERITPLWKRIPFLQKVSLRNMFRYKRRLFMMLIGISCCSGLILTAFGVRDSMVNIGSLHFEEVQHYDLQISYCKGDEETIFRKLEKIEGISETMPVSLEYVDLNTDSTMNGVNLICAKDTEKLKQFWNFDSDSGTVPLPDKGEVIIGQKVADRLNLEIGDTLEMQNENHEHTTVTVNGIFRCYVDNYILISESTYATAFGNPESNMAMIISNGDEHTIAKALAEITEVTGVSCLSTSQDSVDGALSCLNYIIWLIVLFSGALAFIVIFNLTNINLAERTREVATVEVLGFYPEETASYILQENLILSIVSGMIGLPLGVLFHKIVMDMINIESVSFNVHISTLSFVAAMICTTLFAFIVNILMKRQVNKVKMAESLKAIE